MAETKAPGNLPSPARHAMWLLADACAFGLAMFKVVECALLYMDGVAGAWAVAGVAAACGAAALVLRAAYVRRFGGGLWLGLALEWAAMGGLALGIARLSLTQRKTQSFNWLPLEWHKILDNHLLLVKISPLFALALAAIVVLLTWLLVTRRRWALLPLLAGAVALTWHQCSIMTKEPVFIVYFIMYILPLLVALAAAAANMPRMGTRTLVYSAAALTLLWHYIGWSPLILDKSFTNMPGVERLYPAPGEKPDFPLAFFRDFQVEPSGRRLFTAYGPTSGMIRLDLRTGKLDLVNTPDALVRYIALDAPRHEFLALDWINSDMLTVSMDTMRTLRRENVYFKKEQLFVPVYFLPHRGRVYATYSERPAVAELSLRPARLRRRLMFRDIGVTRFRSGVWKAAIDPEKNKMYAEVGMTDLRDEFVIARVNLDTFKLDGTARLPEGGLELTIVPDARRIIATSFFSRRMYEFDMDTMKRTRVLRGPLSCRNLVYDPGRGLLIGTGFLNGEFMVIDYRTGRVVKSARVGNKAASLYITPDGENVFLGSTWGIFRIRMKEFLGR